MAEHQKVKFYYDAELAKALSKKICAVYQDFDRKSFVRNISSQVDDLEYKDRVAVITSELKAHLPDDYCDALKILLEILGPENKKETGMFTEGYWISPIAYFVEIYGHNNYGASMRAIAEITKRHTSEYTIRPYLEQDSDRALKQMVRWSKSRNFHLRRLASEGVRPRLPWARNISKFKEDPSPIRPILENLKGDKIRYVQKSVANCINDILKDNQAIGLDLLTSWSRNSPSRETKWIIKHSLRKLKKSENVRALKIVEKIS